MAHSLKCYIVFALGEVNKSSSWLFYHILHLGSLAQSGYFPFFVQLWSNKNGLGRDAERLLILWFTFQVGYFMATSCQHLLSYSPMLLLKIVMESPVSPSNLSLLENFSSCLTFIFMLHFKPSTSHSVYKGQENKWNPLLLQGNFIYSKVLIMFSFSLLWVKQPQVLLVLPHNCFLELCVLTPLLSRLPEVSPHPPWKRSTVHWAPHSDYLVHLVGDAPGSAPQHNLSFLSSITTAMRKNSFRTITDLSLFPEKRSAQMLLVSPSFSSLPLEH